MTPMEAWRIISANLCELYKRRRAENHSYKGYTAADAEAEVMAFMAFKMAVDGKHTADVVEVVRCKDCVFFKESEKPHNYYCEWCGKHLDVYECDYCSRGIRRG